MGIQSDRTKLGFQESNTLSAEATIYPHNDDPVLSRRGGAIELNGRNERSLNPSIVKFQTMKTISAAGGTFTVDVKEPRGRQSLLDIVADDDWIDLVSVVNGERFHLMRGRVTSLAPTEGVAGEGATTRTLTISAKEFGSVFEDTPIWYNQFRGENAGFADTLQIFSALNIASDPAETVRKILYGFMESMTSKRRANWLLPLTMPNRAASFPQTVQFFQDDFDPDPARVSLFTQLLDPNGEGIWKLAQEWGDPMFCELFTDLIDISAPTTNPYLQPGKGYSPDQTQMAVIFRTRPFPRLASTLTTSEKVGINSPWFNLPTATVQPQELSGKGVSRGGAERFNAFFVAPVVQQQLAGSMLDLQGPLWDEDDVERHGLRQFNVDSRYIATENDLFTLSAEQRWQVLCFHALNPYLYSGSLPIKHLRPDIRVGMRARVLEDPVETYYVENVQHQWALGAARTTLGVTRGWRGTDKSYLAALSKVTARFKLVRDDATDATLALPSAQTRLA